MCQFVKENGNCHLSKKKCTVSEENKEKCNYYIRQYPKDPKILLGKFNKALVKALKKRDVFNQYSFLQSLYKVDPSLSVFENVQKCLLGVKPLEVSIKQRRRVKEHELYTNVLASLTSNLYEESKLRVLQKNEEAQEIIVENEEGRLLVKVSLPLDSFLAGVKQSKNPTKYYKDHTKIIRKL